MKYNFDEVVNRYGTDSLKWDVKENELPMWVADMDFKTAPEIIAALRKRVDYGIFGYSNITKEWYEAYINWWQKRHNLAITEEQLIFCTGVVPAISSIVRKLTTPNENVLIQTPVYNIFFNSIINNGCRVLESPLVYKDMQYSIDFDDLEKKLKNPQTTLMILCNPHNPVGKIWDKDVLSKIGSLCHKYNVVVISDEIHCDLTRPDKNYVPFASVSEECAMNSITCIAPTKTFNLAGMQSAAVFVPNPFLRHKVWRALNTDEVAEPNSLATLAAVAAFNNGEIWLDELREYIWENRKIVTEFINKNIPQIKVVQGDATYLMWLDATKLYEKNQKIDTAFDLSEFIRKETGLYLCGGAEYGKVGETFLRMNVACPKAIVKDGLERLKTAVELLVLK